MKIDFDHIAQIIREVAAQEILPRFQKLAIGDIMEKSPGDLVTTADIKAEFALSKRLKEHLPASQIIGEEAASRHPDILSILDGDDPVWIIDPVDGTRNFTQGNDRFATILALAHKKTIIAGWIYDPFRNHMAMAELNNGVSLNNQAVLFDKSFNLNDLSLKLNLTDRKILSQNSCDFTLINHRYGSCAHDYLSFLRGETQGIQFKGNLYPWDHAAGSLMLNEMGFHLRTLSPNNEINIYTPFVHNNTRLLVAPTEEQWHSLNTALTQSDHK